MEDRVRSVLNMVNTFWKTNSPSFSHCFPLDDAPVLSRPNTPTTVTQGTQEEEEEEEVEEEDTEYLRLGRPFSASFDQLQQFFATDRSPCPSFSALEQQRYLMLPSCSDIQLSKRTNNMFVNYHPDADYLLLEHSEMVKSHNAPPDQALPFLLFRLCEMYQAIPFAYGIPYADAVVSLNDPSCAVKYENWLKACLQNGKINGTVFACVRKPDQGCKGVLVAMQTVLSNTEESSLRDNVRAVARFARTMRQVWAQDLCTVYFWSASLLEPGYGTRVAEGSVDLRHLRCQAVDERDPVHYAPNQSKNLVDELQFTNNLLVRGSEPPHCSYITATPSVVVSQPQLPHHHSQQLLQHQPVPSEHVLLEEGRINMSFGQAVTANLRAQSIGGGERGGIHQRSATTRSLEKEEAANENRGKRKRVHGDEEVEDEPEELSDEDSEEGEGELVEELSEEDSEEGEGELVGESEEEEVGQEDVSEESRWIERTKELLVTSSTTRSKRSSSTNHKKSRSTPTMDLIGPVKTALRAYYGCGPDENVEDKLGNLIRLEIWKGSFYPRVWYCGQCLHNSDDNTATIERLNAKSMTTDKHYSTFHRELWKNMPRDQIKNGKQCVNTGSREFFDNHVLSYDEMPAPGQSPMVSSYRPRNSAQKCGKTSGSKE